MVRAADTTPGQTAAALPPALLINTPEGARSALRSHADIGHRLFEDLELDGIVAVQSLFKGVIFRRCTLQNCDLRRSDFEGARFEHCKFIDSNWDHTDVRSSQFAECTFERASFCGAHITDNGFLRCKLREVSFSSATMIGNSFEDSLLSRIINDLATILHSEFRSVRLEEVKLADCTALYSIFDACEFSAFSINCDALGLTYGLTAADLGRIGLVFLGGDEQVPDGLSAAEAIVETFRTRRWPLHLAIASLCYSEMPRADAWRLIFDVLSGQIAERRGGTVDDVQFVMRVCRLLEPQARLPMAAVISGFDRVSRLSLGPDLPSAEHRASDLIRGELTLLLATMQEKLLDSTAAMMRAAKPGPVVVEFRFRSRPPIDPTSYLTAIAYAEGQPAIPLSGRQGSWIQPLQTTVEGAVQLMVALYLLEGFLIQLTRLRARTTALLSSKVPQAYLDMAQNPRQEVPPLIGHVLKSLYQNYLGGHLTAPPRDMQLAAGDLSEAQIVEAKTSPPPPRGKRKGEAARPPPPRRTPRD